MDISYKIMVRLLYIALILFTSGICAQTTNYASYVDTKIGTKGNGLGCGFTFVAATYPFGMMQFGPAFFTPHKGIVVNQMSGAGCPHMGNFPALPVVGRLDRSPGDMNSFPSFKSVSNTSAGQLSVEMPDGIGYDVTVSKRSGVAQFSFPTTQNENTILIGSGVSATFIENAMVEITSARTCEGFAQGGDFCGSKAKYRVYFVAEFDRDAKITGTWAEGSVKDGRKIAGGANSGAYFTFDTQSDRDVEYKVAISYVSIENARENLLKDNGGRDFDQVKEAAIAEWNSYLGLIDVESVNEDRKIQFYSALYHTMIHPNIFSDSNGEYMGGDFKVHKSQQGMDVYTTWSGWDTYRTQSQLLAMLLPDIASDMMQSLVNFADQSGGFGRWVVANIETGIMHGDPMSIIISNTHAFGAREFDIKGAYRHMLNSANVVGTLSQNIEVRPGLENYLRNGFENASLCLEYASADYAIGEFARQAMDNSEDAEYFIARAENWRNLFDPSTNWLRSRWAHDKVWKDPDHDWREATKENYFWMVPHNLPALIDTMGGMGAASKRLDTLFVRLDATYDQHHFAAGNEPNFLAPWVYNWTDTPYKTSEVIHRVLDEMYTSEPTGLPGNDDCGAMGAWYVFASVGLYPVVPGVAGFSVNAPQFEHITISLPNSKKLEISGGRASKSYIKSMRVNGARVNKSWIDWSEISNGGSIEYIVSPKPNLKWAK